MPKFATLTDRPWGLAARLRAAVLTFCDREASRLGLFWHARFHGRGTLAHYRVRHRPLAGPAPGARLPR
jgi:hypothetical protein